MRVAEKILSILRKERGVKFEEGRRGVMVCIEYGLLGGCGLSGDLR
jgi:hypothetical protein